MAFSEGIAALPPLPEYTLHPLPPIFAWIPDAYLAVLMPVVAYWVVSMFFHWIDVKNYFAKYRLHTPAEIVKRNHVSRYDVARDVIIQQIIQTIVGCALTLTEPMDMYGKEAYDVAVWARRIRIAQHAIPPVLAVLSIDARGLAKNLAAYPALAGALAGGASPGHNATVLLDGIAQSTPGFAKWEMLLAQAIYWVLVPAVQYFVAVVFMDTWQYFLHRAMHMNKWLYTTFHSRHHRLYVPYAYGALYNHPFEGFLLDTLGGALSYKVAGLNTRQGLWFFTSSTIKTVDDHCGYALPWDPLQRLTSNNAGYHDVHHQSWGIKTNFSQPFFTFWDRVLGTTWAGGDVSARYARAAKVAQQKLDAETPGSTPSAATSTATSVSPYTDADPTAAQLHALPGPAAHQAASSRQQVLDDPSPAGGSTVLAEEAAEEQREEEQRERAEGAAAAARKGTRRRTASALKAMAVHGRSGGILGVEHAR